MNPAIRSTQALDAVATSAAPAGGFAWSKLLDGMPVVIVYRAIQDIRRQRAHRQLVLQAFRR